MDLYSLPAVTVLSDSVTIVEHQAVKIVRIISPKARAAIALHGAHLLSYQPQQQSEMIWISEAAIFDGKAALRGGVPICWPWFGGLAAPSHGFARTSEWELVEHRENDNGVIVCLGLKDNDTTRTIWPHAFALRLWVEIGDELKMTLEMENTDTTPWQFSAALHTYLNIADIHTTKITGMGPSYIDKLQNNLECQGGETLKLSAGIDRIYTQPDAMIHVEDHHHQRTLHVSNQGHNSAVLWNPWANGAAAMNDMTDDGYQTMLCVESTVFSPSLEQGLRLAPGEKHQLITRIAHQ